MSWLKYLDLAGGILISVLIIYVGLTIVHEETSNLLGRQENNKNLVRNIKNHILKNKNIKRVENINLIKFGQTYLAIFEIYFSKNITIKEADEERNTLEEEIKARYSQINKIIIKICYKGE